MIWTLNYIALGGARGSVLRCLMVAAIGAPLGTLAVIALGSFLIGIGFGALDAHGGWQIFLMTGVLCGFTTVSAVSQDTLGPVAGGQVLHPAADVGASVALSLCLGALGAAQARRLA